MILQQNSTDVRVNYFYDKDNVISPIDVLYERHIVNPNGLIQLKNIPSPLHTVFTITRRDGVNVIQYNKVESVVNQYDFMVDYINGILTFHSSQVSKEIQISYTNSIGKLNISADVIFTNIDNQGNIVQTLGTMIDEGRSVLSDLSVLGGASKVITELQGYIESARELTGNIIQGSDVNTELKKSTDTAKSTNTTLNSTIVNANNKINDMNSWVESHGDIVNLDNRVGSAENKLNTVNASLDNKANYFETITSMRESNKIKKDSVCKTLGYYKAGDGGGAIYRITDNPALENAFSFSVAKGLTAELIYDDEINIKQLGARDFDDNGNKVDIKPFIDLYLAKTNPVGNATVNKKIIKLFIPAGRWFSSSCKLKGSSIYIHGTNAYSYPYATGTIIMPLQDNQLNLWIIGDDTTESAGLEYGNISLKNLMFSTHNASKSDSIHVAGLIADKCYTCGKLLHISRVYGGVFDNIHFTNYIGTPLTINSSNEIIFNDFTFRNGDAFESGNVVFDNDITGNKNISACFFDKFSFEGVKGDLFNFKTGSKFINNKIGTIIFEDREVKVTKDGVFRDYSVTNDEGNSFTSKSIFNIEEQEYCELNIDNVLLNNFGKVVFTLNEIEYLFDTIVKENGKIAKGHVNIKNVSHVGARRNTMLLNKNSYEGLGSYNFKFVCENVNHIDSSSYDFVINTYGSMKPYIRYKDIGYKKCIDYVTSPNVVLNKNGKVGYYMPVVTDTESLTSEKLVVDNLNYKKYLSSFSSEASCFIIPVIGNKLHIRVKTKTGFLAHCYLIESSGQKDYTVESKGESYNWYTIDFTSYRQVHLDKEMLVALRTLTADETNYVKLDVFYWE